MGNEDPSPAERDFTIDTTPSIDSGPAEGAVSGPKPTFTFSSPSADHFQCRFDANPFGPCSGANSHTPGARLSTGYHTFRVRGITASGRISPAAISHFKADATPPTVTFPSPPQVDGPDGSATITFRASDPSGVIATACSLDSGAWVKCASPVTYRNLSAGSHQVRVRATDKWGNRSAPAAVSWQQPAR